MSMNEQTEREEFDAEFVKLGYQWSDSNQAKAFLGWRMARAAIQAIAPVPAGYVLVERQILEDAESSLGAFCSDEGWGDKDMQAMDNLSAILSAAPQPAQQVAQQKPAQDEPVAWLDEDMDCAYTSSALDGGHVHGLIPLYTHPQASKPNTEAQRAAAGGPTGAQS